MTCETCGTAITTADGVCVVCDPWAVRVPERRARAKSAGIGANLAPAKAKPGGATRQGQDASAPKWLRQTLAKQYPPEAVEAGMRRGPVVRYSVLGYYVALAVIFFVLLALVNSGNYQSLADWRYLGCSPVLLLIGLAIYGRTQRTNRKVGWFAAYMHYIRDNRPDLGFRWIVRMRELRTLRVVSTVTFVLYLALIYGNLISKPGDAGEVHALFVIDGVGFAIMTLLAWYNAAVLNRRLHRKIAARVALPLAPRSPLQ
jgi:hypothetical protein